MILRKTRLLLLGALLSALVDLAARETQSWTVLHDCRLIVNPADDGDSFHASHEGKEYIFRLYLVDAPETEATVPARLIEQAKDFEITVPQVIEVGEAAKKFTREKLAEPFTVFTRMSGAMGRSKLERFYAFVQTKEGDLGEQLVRNGLARVHGTKVIPPGLSNARQEVEKLQQFEQEARQEKIGGWGINVGRLAVRAEKLTSPFTIFAPSDKKSPPVAADQTEAKLDINAATEEELKSIPGIGPVMVAKIIAARPFASADDLKKVNGIGEKRYAQLRPYFQ